MSPLEVKPLPPTRLGKAPTGAVVLVSGELLLQLVDAANPGSNIAVAWGEPQPWPFVGFDGRVLYEPTFADRGGSGT